MFNIDHISISAEQLEETLKFYNNFGFKVYKEYHILVKLLFLYILSIFF